MDYDQYSVLIISDATAHDKKFKYDTKFLSKSRRSVYELEQLSNDGDNYSFEIDSYVDMIQAYASKKRLISSIMPKERCYSLYQEEKSIWDKILEAVKATILGNSKTPHKPYTYVNFHYVTRGDLIKAGPHQFYFGKNSNGPSKYDISDKNHHTDADGDTSMILANLYKRKNVYP